MRSILLTTIAALAISVAGTPAALAHGHHAHHPARHHAVRTERFGSVAQAGSPGAPQTGPQTPSSAPTTAAPMVTAFTGGVLTITLADGSTVSGAVTVDTAIDCAAKVGSPSQGEDRGDQSDDQGGDGSHDGGNSQDGNSQDGNSQDGNSQDGNSQDGDGQGASPGCTTSALVAGTMLVGAELRLSFAGAVWETIELAG